MFPGKVLNRKIGGESPASATVAVPAATLDEVLSSGSTLVANITLNFTDMSHAPYVVVLNGPDDLSLIDASSPFYLATIMVFGHLRHSGALRYALPLGEKLGGASTGQRSDGTLRIRVLPLHVAMGQHGTGDASAVELLSVNFEVY